MKLKNLFIVVFLCIIHCSLFTIHCNAQAPYWVWAKVAGGHHGGSDIGTSVATDTKGFVYVAGYFASDSIFFDSSLKNSGSKWSSDIFLVKYDASGKVVWAVRAGGSGNDQAFSVTTDLSGNVYIAGCFESDTIYFDDVVLYNSSPGNSDAFLAKKYNL